MLAVVAVAVLGTPWLHPRTTPGTSDSNVPIPADRGERPTTETNPAAKLPPPDVATTNAETPKAATALPVARPFTWAASRRGNEVRLSGHVPSLKARAAVLEILRREMNGVSVVDEMREAAGYDSSVEFSTAAGLALGGLAQLTSGSVDLSDATIGIRGQATGKDALAAVTTAFASLPSGLAASAISVTAAVIAPYTFVAQRAPGVVILSGYVPSPEARAEVARQVRGRFFHEQIVDRARLADGAPANFAASAAFALDQLAQLAAGEASVTGDHVRVTGDMLYAQAADQVRDRVAKNAPAGVRGSAEIKVRGQSTVRAEASP